MTDRVPAPPPLLSARRPDEYKELVDAIFRFDWNHPPNVSFAYQQLLTQLVSANSTYLLPALHTLVRAMLLRVDEMDDSGGGARERRGSVHSSLQTLLYLVPSGGSKLFPVLSSHYPHKRRSGDILADYARQLLEVLRYMPSAQGKVLQLIIEKCLEIDVEIKIMDNGEAVRDEEEGEGMRGLGPLRLTVSPPACTAEIGFLTHSRAPSRPHRRPHIQHG